MAAFKSKFKNLLRISDQKGIADEHLEGDITETQQLQQHAVPAKKENPADLAEIIAQIHEIYYDEDKDCCQFELLELDKECTMSILESRIMELKRQEMAARKKVSDLVLANYIDYVQELQRVAELQLSLQNTVSVCVNGRRSLTMAKQGVSHGGLGVLAKHRKRQRLNSVLSTLRTLKTLQMTDVRLQEMLKEGNYAGATQLCLECLSAVPLYKQYTCISDLGSKLKDTQHVIEDQLEEVLASMCTSFDSRQYQQVQIAYRLLGKSQSAIDQLLMHFTSTIHSNAFSVVFEHAKQSGSSTESVDQKVPYRDLCKAVPSKLFTTCLKSLCKAMWKIMKNYYQIKTWHENINKKEEKEVVFGEDEMDGDETLFNKTYVKQKLELGLSRIWQDVQQKVKPFLVSANMAHFAYDNMMRVLDTINRLISLGIEFCGKGSDSLQESIRQQSLNYFKTYHRNRLDELRAFLENEAWEICPVRASFTFYSLREFHFMKNLHVADVSETSSTGEVGGRFDSDVDPFTDEDFDDDAEEIMESSQGADAASDDEHHWEDEENEDLHKEYVDELTDDTLKTTSKRFPRQGSTVSTSTTQRGPILSNTTLTVLRLFGNYMQMMHVLKPIASDVLECLTQLFDYYLYAIFTFFATDPDESSEKDLSGKMKTTLKRIREQLIFNPQEPSRDEGVIKVPSPTVYELLNLDDPKTLYGLSARLVATESLVFLAKQFESLQSYCENCILETRRGFLQQYFSQTVYNVDELRKPVYSQVSKNAINYGQMLTHMATVKWDIKDIMSQHSQYVDSLLKEFADFADQISKIEKEVGIPLQAYNILWEMSIKMANKTFVEGFSQAKKCSNEGRALMQLDYQQFLTKLGKLTDLRPIPDHDYVETYIKAYYLTETDMERWIQEHREYTPKQVTSLVMCGVGAHLNRKARQKLLAVISSDDTNK